MLKFDHLPEENKLVCIFSGSINTVVCAELAPEIDKMLNGIAGGEAVPEQLQVVFDLGEVAFVASSFIRISMNTAKKLTPGNFSIVNCNPFIKKTLKIVGLDDLLHVC